LIPKKQLYAFLKKAFVAFISDIPL